LHAHAVITPLRTLAQHCKRFSPLLAAPAAVLLTQGQAKAVLTYNIFESGGNVVIQASGSLNLTGAAPASTGSCGISGGIGSSFLCTGPDPGANIPAFRISGPASVGSVFFSANSVSGIYTSFFTGPKQLIIDSAYVSNAPIVSSATFNGKTLASMGFTTTGLIGTWTLDGTSESIQVILGAPSPSGAAVPGPLPLLGAGAAFGWSRRLRKRISAPVSTPPQA
jgi:hypothetical protein